MRCGNSLISPAMYDWRPPDHLSGSARERVNPFDWDEAFPEIAARGGFDVVIGNPPYVKLQHFRRVYEETALLLRGGSAGATYHATQTGNFDLYLPFIEKGLALLGPAGRMGYIAPNLWPTLEYGEALRRRIVAGRQLERWIDFRAHQVFEEATIYTALQIFSAAPNDAVEIAFAGDGDLERIDWMQPDALVPYTELDPDGAPWLFAPDAMRALIRRLAQTCDRLDDPQVTSGIVVGIQTSADHIYHLRRLADGRYLHQPKPVRGKAVPPIEVRIEDAIMKPLVSGAEAKRFQVPETDTFLLFPYTPGAGARLWTTAEMEARFPCAWEYLRSHETELRARESRSFDDDEWYRFGRNQNIDKQETVKLIVPRLVASLRVALDERARYYCDNVDVGGVIPAQVEDLAHLGGILGAPTTNSIFRWLSKPFRGEYLSANRQFIAPLPIPRAGDADRAEVARIARALQADYTERARLRRGLDERIAKVTRRRRPYEWLLPDVRPVAEIEASIVNQMETVRRRMAERQYEEQVEAAVARVGAAIRLDSRLEAVFDDGELMMLVDRAPVARGIYADAATGAFLLAQWQAVALAFEPAGRKDGERLIAALRLAGDDAPQALRDQIIERQEELARITLRLRDGEAALHALTCRLFALSPAERRLVERKQ